MIPWNGLFLTASNAVTISTLSKRNSNAAHAKRGNETARARVRGKRRVHFADVYVSQRRTVCTVFHVDMTLRLPNRDGNMRCFATTACISSIYGFAGVFKIQSQMSTCVCVRASADVLVCCCVSTGIGVLRFRYRAIWYGILRVKFCVPFVSPVLCLCRATPRDATKQKAFVGACVLHECVCVCQSTTHIRIASIWFFIDEMKIPSLVVVVLTLLLLLCASDRRIERVNWISCNLATIQNRTS